MSVVEIDPSTFEFDLSKFTMAQLQLWNDLLEYLAKQTIVSDADKVFQYKLKSYFQVKNLPLAMTFILKLEDVYSMWRLGCIAEYYTMPEGSCDELKLQNVALIALRDGILNIHNRLNTAADKSLKKLKEGKTEEQILAEAVKDAESDGTSGTQT